MKMLLLLILTVIFSVTKADLYMVNNFGGGMYTVHKSGSAKYTTVLDFGDGIFSVN